MIWLLLLVLAQEPEPSYRTYPFAEIAKHSKVCAVGKVVYRRKQAGDGDWHITITNRLNNKLVLEIIPEFPITPP